MNNRRRNILIFSLLGIAGIAVAQFSVTPQGDITAHSISLIPTNCTGYLFNTNGSLSCQPGTGGTGGGTSTLGPSVSATNNGTQTFAVGIGIFSYNENVWDTGSIHSLASPTQFVAPSSGFYLASASALALQNNASFQIFFRVNSADIDGAGASQGTASNNINTAGAYSAVLKLNGGDVVQAFEYTSTGFSTDPYYSTFQLTKLASTF